MSERYQESKLEFRRDLDIKGDQKYPHARHLVVYQYGGTMEECVKTARERFNLSDDWVVASFEDRQWR